MRRGGCMESYAKRLHNPFRGLLQVIASQQLRALSFDGRQWELQFLCDMLRVKPSQPAFAPRFQYARIGRWEARSGFKPYPLDPAINCNIVESAVTEMLEALAQAQAPLPQDDAYELWLLDGQQHLPLALLASCRQPGEMEGVQLRRPAWKAISAAQLGLDNTEEESQRGMPPLNYRLEMLVKKRAGQNPAAKWFRRLGNGDGEEVSADGKVVGVLPTAAFPECLLREDWDNPVAQDLCDRYLQRLAPQLLVLQGLSHAGRDRLEQMASHHVIEVDRYFHLYPAVADPQRMTALRVEARLRMACDCQAKRG